MTPLRLFGVSLLLSVPLVPTAFAQEAVEPEPEPASTPLPAGSDISATEVNALLRQLRQMRSGLDSDERKRLNEALRLLTVASNSGTDALTLWTNSIRTVDFERKGKKDTEFNEWRKKNDARLHDVGFGLALRLQCRYLKLCLEANDDARLINASPAIVALLEDAIKVYPQCGQHAQVLREDAFGSVIAKRLGIEKHRPEGLPGGVLALDGHFNRFVKLAHAKNPAAVATLWELRLKHERALAEAVDQNARLQRRKAAAGGSPSAPRPGVTTARDKREAEAEKEPESTKAVDTFEEERLPDLTWRMGEDVYKAGMRRRGIEIFFGVVKKYPKHPSVSDWVDRITEIAEGLSADAAAGASEAAPASPEATAAGEASATETTVVESVVVTE